MTDYREPVKGITDRPRDISEQEYFRPDSENFTPAESVQTPEPAKTEVAPQETPQYSGADPLKRDVAELLRRVETENRTNNSYAARLHSEPMVSSRGVEMPQWLDAVATAQELLATKDPEDAYQARDLLLATRAEIGKGTYDVSPEIVAQIDSALNIVAKFEIETARNEFNGMRDSFKRSGDKDIEAAVTSTIGMAEQRIEEGKAHSFREAVDGLMKEDLWASNKLREIDGDKEKSWMLTPLKSDILKKDEARKAAVLYHDNKEYTLAARNYDRFFANEYAAEKARYGEKRPTKEEKLAAYDKEIQKRITKRLAPKLDPISAMSANLRKDEPLTDKDLWRKYNEGILQSDRTWYEVGRRTDLEKDNESILLDLAATALGGKLGSMAGQFAEKFVVKKIGETVIGKVAGKILGTAAESVVFSETTGTANAVRTRNLESLTSASGHLKSAIGAAVTLNLFKGATGVYGSTLGKLTLSADPVVNQVAHLAVNTAATVPVSFLSAVATGETEQMRTDEGLAAMTRGHVAIGLGLGAVHLLPKLAEANAPAAVLEPAPARTKRMGEPVELPKSQVGLSTPETIQLNAGPNPAEALRALGGVAKKVGDFFRGRTSKSEPTTPKPQQKLPIYIDKILHVKAREIPTIDGAKIMRVGNEIHVLPEGRNTRVTIRDLETGEGQSLTGNSTGKLESGKKYLIETETADGSKPARSYQLNVDNVTHQMGQNESVVRISSGDTVKLSPEITSAKIGGPLNSSKPAIVMDGVPEHVLSLQHNSDGWLIKIDTGSNGMKSATVTNSTGKTTTLSDGGSGNRRDCRELMFRSTLTPGENTVEIKMKGVKDPVTFKLEVPPEDPAIVKARAEADQKMELADQQRSSEPQRSKEIEIKKPQHIEEYPEMIIPAERSGTPEIPSQHTVVNNGKISGMDITPGSSMDVNGVKLIVNPSGLLTLDPSRPDAVIWRNGKVTKNRFVQNGDSVIALKDPVKKNPTKEDYMVFTVNSDNKMAPRPEIVIHQKSGTIGRAIEPEGIKNPATIQLPDSDKRISRHELTFGKKPSDGKTVIEHHNPANQVVIERYLPDGTIDKKFTPEILHERLADQPKTDMELMKYYKEEAFKLTRTELEPGRYRITLLGEVDAPKNGTTDVGTTWEPITDFNINIP